MNKEELSQTLPQLSDQTLNAPHTPHISQAIYGVYSAVLL